MRKIVTFFFIAVCILSCNNKLNILLPYKDITVVYGLLDQSDTIHYIRINKAFEGPGNALTMAQQYDSINYPAGTLSVVLQDYNNGTLVKTIPLDTTYAIPVAPGLFSYPRQIEYYTKYKLDSSDQYKLIITNNKSGKQVIGTTKLIPDIALAGTGYSSSLPMSYGSQQPIIISWTSVPNGDIYQLTIRFFYKEINIISHDTTIKYADWVFPAFTATDNLGGDFCNCSYTLQNLLHFLNGTLTINNNVTRLFDTLNIIFTTGSQDFYTYFNLSQPPVGVNQDVPFYTDVTNGIGIFTARHTQTIKKVLTSETLDSIYTESLTSSLGFGP